MFSHQPPVLTVTAARRRQVLTAFCNVLHILRPEKAPAFAYAWLDIVSHRVFIGRMLAVTPQHKVRTHAGVICTNVMQFTGRV